jgi:hypothetical protein
MPQGDGLRQVIVEPEGPGDGPGDLGHFEGMRQARPIVVPERGQEDLGLVLEAAEGLGMDDPVTVPLEVGPEDVLGFRTCPALGVLAQARLGRQDLLFDGLDILPDTHINLVALDGGDYSIEMRYNNLS